MAEKVRIIGIEGKYAISNKGQRLRIIGDNVPLGNAYTDGRVVYGYSINNHPFLPLIRKTKGGINIDLFFDALMKVRDTEGLAFVADVFGLWSGHSEMQGAYPYKFDEYDCDFWKKITLPNATYILGSDKLFTINTDNGNITLHDVINNTNVVITLPSVYWLDNYYYDIGRNGQIGLCAIGNSGQGFLLNYIDGTSVSSYSKEDFQRALFASGDFPDAQSYNDIAIGLPKDINVSDAGDATCTIYAETYLVSKKYKVEFHNYLDMYNYDFADCGDATGDFNESTGIGTITVGNYTFSNVKTGTKATVTDDYIFIYWFNRQGSHSIASGIELKQYDRQTGTLLKDYSNDIYEMINTRLDLFYVDDLLRLWNAGELIDIDEYFDARLTVKPISFDTKRTVT